jgi:long-chain fatty acid transport protein
MKTARFGVSTTALLTGLFWAGSLQAAGFAVKEQSSTAQGNAFAGATAGAEDISYMYFNPAGLTRHPDFGAHASLSYIIPEAKFKDGEASTIAGVPITGTPNDGDIADDAPVPAIYLSAPLADRLQFGLGINAPFGLTTEHEDGWIGRYHALKSDLLTVNINPAVAIEAAPGLSFGIGAQIQYAETELTSAVDFGSIGALSGNAALEAISVPTAQDGEASVEGDDWGFGFNLGFLFEPAEGTRFGVAYRSEIDHDVEGDAEFELDAAGVGGALSAATGAFVDTGARINISSPASLSIGAYHELSDKVAVMAEAAWTDWSSFDELRIEFDNPAQDDNVTEENWDDTFFIALGATYRPVESLAIRAGIAYDETPIADEFQTPRVPDASRYWTSIGLSYDPVPAFGVSASYTHIFLEDNDVDLQATDEGNTFRGNLSGTFEKQIDIITVGATFRF